MKTRVYFVLLVLCLGLVLFSYTWPPFPWSVWPAILLLAVLAVLAESLAFELPVGGTVSLAFALYIAGLLYAGPLPAVLMAVVGAVPPQDFRKHKSLFRMLFNITMFALSVLVAGIVFLELGGVPLVYARVTSTITPSVLTPVLAAAMTMHLLNTTLFSAVVSLSTGIPMLRVWREQNLASYLASFVVLALLGFGMAQLIDVAGWSAAALLVVPFAVARQTFQVYNQLTNAYSETIRSFVAAIEAKDPYTRGHSERVAQYSRRIAELRGLKGRNLERVEYAALLHDVGKIGVRRGILTKPGRLTDEELAEIHSHPEAGCKILGSVDFLEDIVPFVRAHHERIDGTGYPDGQTGQAIPLEARMLAVADAYDAMTSNRPYREALSHDAALSELRRVAGTQLDPVFVSALADNFEAQERGVES